MNIFKRIFSRGQPATIETEERAYSPTNRIELFMQNFNSAGLNETQILAAVNSNPVFFSCINLIANSVASVDYTVNDARVAKILEQPNSSHSQHTFMWLVSAYLSTLGKVYIWVRKDKSLVTVSPTRMMHTDGMRYQFMHGQEMITATLHEDLIRITAPDLQSPFAGGTGLGEVLSQEIDISEAASTHELGYLKNHAVPSMLVNYKGMSDENLIQLQSAWNSKFKGGNAAGRTGFSNADSLDLKPISSPFKDLGLVELRAHSADTIREAFGIPKSLLGAQDTAQRSGIRGDEYILAKYVIKPRVDLILNEFNTKLLPLLGSKGEITCEEIIPQDEEYRLQVAALFAKGIPVHMTLNEARIMQDLPPVEGGDALGGVGAPAKIKEKVRNVPLIHCSMGVFNEERHFHQLFTELEHVDG